MAEYTFDYGKRTVIKDGVVYLSTDLYGRINLPISLVKPELRNKKCTVELQGDKVILKYSKNQPDNNNKRRVTIPTAIRCVLRLQRDDYFKVVRNVADLFMKNSAGDGEKEDFWSGAAQDMLVAIMVYLWKTPYELKTFGRVVRLVNSVQYKDGKIDELCELARCLKNHCIDHPNDVAAVNWASIQGTPQETLGSICKVLSTRLRLWAVEDVDEMTATDEMDFDSIGKEKTAIFLIIPAARQTYKAIANIFYSQLFERLMFIANRDHNGRLPMLVSCEMDEFANIGKIPNFNETLSVVRSYNIRICIVLQGLSQLKALYEKQWDSILGNCSIFNFLGTNDQESKEYVSKKLGKTTVRVDSRSYNRGGKGGGGSDSESYVQRDLLAPDEISQVIKPKGKTKRYGGNCIVFVDEFKPFFLCKYDTMSHPLFPVTGSSFPNGIPNNTNINEVYASIKIEETETVEHPNVAKGDINDDLRIDAIDACHILSTVALLSTGGNVDEKTYITCDVDSDGVITSNDAAITLSFYSYLMVNSEEEKMSFEEYIS